MTEDAVAFLRICSLHLAEGELLPYEYQRFLGRRLEEMSKSPWEQSLLARYQGQNGGDQFTDDLALAYEVWKLTREKDLTILAAAGRVADRRNELTMSSSSPASEQQCKKLTASGTKKIYERYAAILNGRDVSSITALASFKPPPRKPSPIENLVYESRVPKFGEIVRRINDDNSGAPIVHRSS